MELTKFTTYELYYALIEKHSLRFDVLGNDDTGYGIRYQADQSLEGDYFFLDVDGKISYNVRNHVIHIYPTKSEAQEAKLKFVKAEIKEWFN